MTIAEILRQEGISDQQALQEHAIVNALSRISRYEAECASFEKKHALTFEDAQKKYDCTGKEDAAFDDDFIEWQFAAQSLAWWKTKLEEARNAL